MTALPLDDRDFLDCELVGAGRAWPTVRDFLKRYSDQSTRFRPRLLIDDIVPGRAAQAADDARRAGLLAAGREADARELGPHEVAPSILVHVDDPAVASNAIERFTESSLQVHLFARTNDDRLLGFHANIGRDDATTRTASALFLNALGANSTPATGEDIFGEAGRAAHREIEPQVRAETGMDVIRNHEQLFLRKAPASPPLSLSVNNQKALPLQVLDRRAEGWTDPAFLAHSLLERPEVPLRTGADMLAAEVGPDSEIRIHTIRRRRTDGRISVNGVEVLDPRHVLPRDVDQWQRVLQQRDRLLANAATTAITRRQPVMVTD